MGKNIVFCADGTWNGPGEDPNGHRCGNQTNVFKLFQCLEGVDSPDSLCWADEQERVAAGTQVAKYLHGVGDSQNPLVKLLGGAFGAGLIARVVRGYTFVSRNYAPGDAIFLVGFSRGAYTARALAGLIGSQGLLDASRLDLQDQEAAYRLGAAVWYQHQRALHEDGLARLESFVDDLPSFLQRPPAMADLRPAPTACVAVWDTVGAMGIPDFAAGAERTDLFRFADTRLGPQVARGLHAVAVDEARKSFQPTLWEPDPRIIQVLFPGAHSDVGGGYAETALADGALLWLHAQLVAQGLRCQAPPAAAADPAGPAHQPWREPVWAFLGQASRVLPAFLVLHPSVKARMAAGPVVPDPGQAPVPYRPQNLPA
jgi:uncharacterized protein (DUF2235 family)